MLHKKNFKITFTMCHYKREQNNKTTTTKKRSKGRSC